MPNPKSGTVTMDVAAAVKELKIRNIVDPRIRKEQKKVAHWNKKALNTANGDVNTGRLFARDITGDPAKWQNTCFSSANHISRVKLKR